MKKKKISRLKISRRTRWSRWTPSDDSHKSDGDDAKSNGEDDNKSDGGDDEGDYKNDNKSDGKDDEEEKEEEEGKDDVRKKKIPTIPPLGHPVSPPLLLVYN